MFFEQIYGKWHQPLRFLCSYFSMRKGLYFTHILMFLWWGYNYQVQEMVWLQQKYMFTVLEIKGKVKVLAWLIHLNATRENLFQTSPTGIWTFLYRCLYIVIWIYTYLCLNSFSQRHQNHTLLKFTLMTSFWLNYFCKYLFPRSHTLRD